MRRSLVLIGTALIAIILLIAFAVHLASFLDVENLRQADAIVVLAGDVNDRRYQKGIELLRAGYGHQMFLDCLRRYHSLRPYLCRLGAPVR